jgi:hypothetical protein
MYLAQFHYPIYSQSTCSVLIRYAPFFWNREDAVVALWSKQAEAFAAVYGYGLKRTCSLTLCCMAARLFEGPGYTNIEPRIYSVCTCYSKDVCTLYTLCFFFSPPFMHTDTLSLQGSTPPRFYVNPQLPEAIALQNRYSTEIIMYPYKKKLNFMCYKQHIAHNSFRYNIW